MLDPEETLLSDVVDERAQCLDEERAVLSADVVPEADCQVEFVLAVVDRRDLVADLVAGEGDVEDVSPLASPTEPPPIDLAGILAGARRLQQAPAIPTPAWDACSFISGRIQHQVERDRPIGDDQRRPDHEPDLRWELEDGKDVHGRRARHLQDHSAARSENAVDKFKAGLVKGMEELPAAEMQEAASS